VWCVGVCVGGGGGGGGGGGVGGGGGRTPGTGSYITNVPWVNSSVFNALTSACVCEHLSHEPHPASCNKTRVMPRPSQREVVSCKAAKGAGTRGYNPKNVPTRTPDLLGGACSNSSSQLQRTYDKYLLFLKTDSSKSSWGERARTRALNFKERTTSTCYF